MLAPKIETLSYSNAILTIVLDKFQSQKAQVVCGEKVKTAGVAYVAQVRKKGKPMLATCHTTWMIM